MAPQFLDAFSTKTEISTFPGFMTLVETGYETGEYDLYIVDFNNQPSSSSSPNSTTKNNNQAPDTATTIPFTRLRIYKGTHLVETLNLDYSPCSGIQTILHLNKDRYEPIVILTSSSDKIYFYMNSSRKCKFVYTLPLIKTYSDSEIEIWQDAESLISSMMMTMQSSEPLHHTTDSSINLSINSEIVANLSQKLLLLLSQGLVEPSSRCLAFSRLETFDEKVSFLKNNPWSNDDILQKPSITCQDTIPRAGRDYESCLVVGVQEKVLYILLASKILESNDRQVEPSVKFQLSSIPILISTWGSYGSEYYIVVFCIDNSLLLMNQECSRKIAQFSSPLLNIITKQNAVYCADSNTGLFSKYNFEGKCLFRIKTGLEILCMSPFEYSSKNFHGVALSLGNNEIHIYNESNLIHVLDTCNSDYTINDPVVSFVFGTYGRETNSLVTLSLSSATLYVRIMKRNPSFINNTLRKIEDKQVKDTVIENRTVSELYLDDIKNEKENYLEIFSNNEFQFTKLQYLAAKAYKESLVTDFNNSKYAEHDTTVETYEKDNDNHDIQPSKLPQLTTKPRFDREEYIMYNSTQEDIKNNEQHNPLSDILTMNCEIHRVSSTVKLDVILETTQKHQMIENLFVFIDPLDDHISTPFPTLSSIPVIYPNTKTKRYFHLEIEKKVLNDDCKVIKKNKKVATEYMMKIFVSVFRGCEVEDYDDDDDDDYNSVFGEVLIPPDGNVKDHSWSKASSSTVQPAVMLS